MKGGKEENIKVGERERNKVWYICHHSEMNDPERRGGGV